MGEMGMSSSKILIGLPAKGEYCFTMPVAKQVLGSSDVAVHSTIQRLRKKGDIAMPYRGFYVIVPPEYRILGCLPAEQFIPSLMEQIGESYYAGLLSAAQYHGAAHHRPQVFQVVTARNKASLECGKVRVDFIARKNVKEMPTNTINTLRGMLRVSSPETTAFDLVGYPHHSGGLDNVATILAELAERLDPAELARIAELSPLTWAQRLGYLLDLVEMSDKTDALAGYLATKRLVATPLVPSQPIDGAEKNQRWQLLVNAEIEAEL
jgi:predicted transcriptional regulator of viral defense system